MFRYICLLGLVLSPMSANAMVSGQTWQLASLVTSIRVADVIHDVLAIPAGSVIWAETETVETGLIYESSEVFDVTHLAGITETARPWSLTAEIETTEEPDPIVPVADATIGLIARMQPTSRNETALEFGFNVGVIDRTLPYEIALNLTRTF